MFTVDWNHLRTLLAIADHGSYTAAAGHLRLTQPTVGRHIAALEAELGVVLVERSARGVVLTDAAHALIGPAREMAEGAEKVARIASGHSVALEGVVTISASEVFAAYLLPPVIAAVRARAPGIHVDLVATSRLSDLRRREADLALRHVRPDDDELIATRLPDGRAYWYGTAAYLDAIGHPDVGSNLDGVALLGWDRTPALAEHLAAIGLRIEAHHTPVVCNDQLVQWAFARAGLGLAVMDARIGDADPTMVRAFPSLPAIPVPMWLAAHREVRTSRRVRVVFDALHERLYGETVASG
jgi:DNA-binding transcriptional LysR family regulator